MKRLSVVFFFISLACTSLAQTFYDETPEAIHWTDSVFNSLSKEQRIAQLMVVRLSAKTGNTVVFYDKKVEELINKYNIGAICLFQGNPAEQANYINHFQSIAKTPLLICIDAETGLGMRMTDSVQKFPDQLTLGAIQDTSLIYYIGKAIGEQCRRAGIQVNFAPVVDINNNPDNPVINIRSFGEDKYKVALFGSAIMRGMQSAGIMACAKHFPGHGDVSVDSHLDLPVINKSYTALDTLELYPFKKLFAAGVGSVMIAHLSIPAIDATKNQPTSLSKKNVTDLLRNTLGYHGISFTDALEMQGVAKYYPQGDAALQSLVAGNDMLCLPGDISLSIEKISKAMDNGVLKEDDINARVKKILLAKYNLGLNAVYAVNTNNLTTDLNEDVLLLRKAVAENAITLLRLNDTKLLPLQRNKKIAYIGVGAGEGNRLSSLLKKYNADAYFFNYNDGENEANKIITALKGKYDAVIIGVHHYHKYPANNFEISAGAIQFINQIQKIIPSVTLVFGNPYAIKNFCTSPNLIACYEDDSIFQHAAFDFVAGNIKAKGTLPVTVCEDFHYGDGIVSKKNDEIVLPEILGLSSKKLQKIDSIVNDAIRYHATPGCVVLVARYGKIAFCKAYGYLTYDSIETVTKETAYDLASVTKISATTIAIMRLYEEGKLDIHKSLCDYLPWTEGTNKAYIPLESLLLHQAGLNPFIAFYKETIDAMYGYASRNFYHASADNLYNIPVAKNMYLRKDWVDTMYKRILESAITTPGKYVYSDNDFILLGKVVEQITGMPLDEYAKETFYQPLEMKSTVFKPAENTALYFIAPTENERKFRSQLIRGYVHDPGAAMFGGVAGHAGLFSNATDLAQLYLMLLNEGEWNGIQFFKKETIEFFTAYHSNVSRRGLGFDKPEKDNLVRREPYPCLSASPETFGHTGFTGTCVWADPRYNLLFIFLSNRVNPVGANPLLGKLDVRKNIQQAVYNAIINTP